ncbi:right-handed parallel beta-helix repeat-containing protein [Methylomonas sp. UP202]|uniref:right-handed parallel beta-helix repeat-containing protein n=1 Tax=unclassified Methylomonas TaxID=2608980 RepID=UPI00247A5058|nr:right-handed parallel beta-helix repeat-containing protein [Methylomonas sp. UP202]WGS86808.1 right-handed parallel beta-helix repeat-containing protein [Methylomonas sp. UP202]
MSIRLLFSVVSLCFCSVSLAKDLYVARNGDDRLDGSSTAINVSAKTGPFKTLNKAQQAIRDLKAAGQLTEAVTVHIGAGTYQLKTPLEFTDADSGEAGKEIIWLGEKGATLVTGGLLLTGCQAYDAENPEQILSCPLDATVADSITAEDNSRIKGNGPAFELFVNDSRMQLARWPDYGWAYVKTPLDDRTQFKVYQSLPAFSGDLSDSQVHIFPGNDYYDQIVGVKTLDLTNNQITLASSTNYDLGEGRRFYLQNAEGFLNLPGEWFYDKNNKQLLLIPPSGVTPKSIAISSTKNLIILTGTHYLGFKNLTFRHSAGDAIVASDSNSIIFDNLEINNIGASAINAKQSNTDVIISNSDIHHTGTGAIALYGGDRPTLQASENRIYNNRIYNYSSKLLMIYGVTVGGVGAHISHNLIAQGTGGAILFSGNDNVLEKNEIYSICQAGNDCGAIYGGRDWTFRGNIIQYNYIHDSYGYGLSLVDIPNNIIRYTYEGARGIYMDDGLSGTTVLGNLLVNAGSRAIQLGNGRDTLILNNVIKTNKSAIFAGLYSPYYNWEWNRASLNTMPINSVLWKTKYPVLSEPMAHDTWMEGNTIQNNVVISTAYMGYSLVYHLPKESNTIGKNIVWHASSDIRVNYKVPDTGAEKGGALWSDWVNQGVEVDSINADPCISIEGRSVKLVCTDSPVNLLGIKGLPSDMGLTQ